MKQRLPKFARILFSIILPEQDREYLLGDYEEIYRMTLNKRGKAAAFVLLFMQLLKSIPIYSYDSLYWGLARMRNYTKTSIRSLMRSRSYSLINVLGLAVGITCAIFILMYIRFETGFDNYHEDADRIFRIPMIKKSPSRTAEWPVNTASLAPALRKEFSQVETAARITRDGTLAVIAGENRFYESRIAHVDPELFDIFTLPFIEGSPSLLERPNSVIISRSAAEKYFGSENPIGRSLTCNGIDYEVVGIVEDYPANTHMKIDIYCSISTMSDQWWYDHWPTGSCYTYVKLSEGVDPDMFGESISKFAHLFPGASIDQEGVEISYYLQKASDIHLYSGLDFEMEAGGDYTHLLVFGAAGLLILIIACMNFINLSTARSLRRAKEVGMRKVAGAGRMQLARQFLSETFIMVMISFSAALLIAVTALPMFNRLSGIEFSYYHIFNSSMIFSCLGIAVLISLAAGTYPAFVLSSYKPAAVFSNLSKPTARQATFRKVLVVTQFAISIFLIAGSMIVYKQVDYMKSSPLGFDKEQKLVVRFSGRGSLEKNYETIKNEFTRHPDIYAAAASNSVPGRSLTSSRYWPTGRESDLGQSINTLLIDYDFLDLYEIEMTAGRMFMREMKADTVMGGIMLTESAANSFGWGDVSDAVGKTFYNMRLPVIGVTKDIHFRGLQHTVEPIVIEYNPRGFQLITLSINSHNVDEVLNYAGNQFEKFFPDKPFDYFFVDTEFDLHYQSDVRLGQIFSLFTAIGILIACLGLFGLAAFSAEQRTREIAIRKVLGSSTPGVVALFIKEFVFWIVSANVIAWPVAWFVMERWLQNFAYRMDISLLTFAVSGIAALVIALLTVLYQTWKAASANPADALRCE